MDKVRALRGDAFAKSWKQGGKYEKEKLFH